MKSVAGIAGGVLLLAATLVRRNRHRRVLAPLALGVSISWYIRQLPELAAVWTASGNGGGVGTGWRSCKVT